MFSSRVSSWNLRDRHMAETLDELDGHLSRRRGRPARIAVWAHNSHLGDARATEMGERGELNLGQLVRERHGAAAALLGFSTYHGTRHGGERLGRAGRDEAGPARPRRQLRGALPRASAARAFA